MKRLIVPKPASAAALSTFALLAMVGPIASDAGLRSADAEPPTDSVAERVQAAAEGRGREVSIPFADHGGIRNWQAVDRDTLLVEGTHRRWYRVELMSGCFELPFAQRVGFRSNPTGDFDRFSSVIVRGQRCTVKSVTEAPPPPRRTREEAPGATTEPGRAESAPAEAAISEPTASEPAAATPTPK